MAKAKVETITAKDAKKATQYKTMKGRIIEVEPSISEKNWPPANGHGSIKYRSLGSGGTIVYGYLKDDYKLKPIGADEKVSFRAASKVKKSAKKVAKIAEPKQKSISVKQYIRDNWKKSDKEIIADLEKMQKAGEQIKTTVPFEKVVRRYRAKLIRTEGFKEVK